MVITARGLNRATLARQMLLHREPLGAAEGVRRAVALQAQQPASPYLALWNRLAGFDPADLDGAFAGRSVVKATLMRITLHAVHADDLPAFHEALQPVLRGARLGPRFTVSGLTAQDADRLVPEVLGYADRPRTNTDFTAWLEERLGTPPHPGAWWGLRHYTPLVHAPTAPPWSFGARPAYRAPDVRPVLADAGTSDARLRTLVLRYLAGFGPASAADVAQFGLVPKGRARAALHALGDRLERLEGPGGEELFDLPGAARPDAGTPAPPRLMAMWDSILLAYADRSRVIPPAYRPLVIRRNGDVLPTLLVDGYVAGVWRPGPGGIEATAFHPLPGDVWEGLAAEARALTAFLAGREPQVYARYGHWWSKIPADAETRLLPAA
ncbi:winged helix DNA-binding domain-containing protein [Streptomyces bambusae]|uniref:winged helix DNA-binding domain-containing protein n=1 Tax=Streptomyces bambusae TaxID=1550616 RepID=UPI001CFE8022|nr:winged helix DNA-binding domain-containing protein [Streptomyces bambusae]MCB5165461.1 winged helix DNA-binding domain-containing protein [Streptomyces bambusae]